MDNLVAIALILEVALTAYMILRYRRRPVVLWRVPVWLLVGTIYASTISLA